MDMDEMVNGIEEMLTLPHTKKKKKKKKKKAAFNVKQINNKITNKNN